MAGLNTQVIYLEQYIESTYFVPTELSRVLNTIKALDERCCDLSDGLHERTAQLLAMPPAYQTPPGPEYSDLMRKVATDQKMLAQFSEEKVQLAQQAYDLLEMHAMELERTMENFESDMRITGMDTEINLAGMAGLDNIADLYNPAALGFDPIQRGRTPKLEDWNLPAPTDAYNSLPLPMGPGLPQPLPIAANPAPTPGTSSQTGQKRAANPPSRTTSQKRLKVEQPEQAVTGAVTPAGTPAPAPQPPVPNNPNMPMLPPPIPPQPTPTPSAGTSGPVHKKRTHSVNSMMSNMAGLPGAAEDGAAAGGATGGQPGSGTFANPGPTSGVGFMKPPPPGLKASANRPQVPGRILGAADIAPALRGRHAELYWPDDASWYLIEIQDVDPVSKKARIVYISGEVEELDLEEIAKDRHMSLIPAEFYGGMQAS